jgi:YjbR
MTPDAFRRIALALPDAEERAHMHHPDFRVGGRIFATLAYPDESWGMVKLTPEQQYNFVSAYPDAFRPVKGAWGLQGATNVHLPKATAVTLRPALKAAWENARQTKPAKRPRKLKTEN